MWRSLWIPWPRNPLRTEMGCRRSAFHLRILHAGRVSRIDAARSQGWRCKIVRSGIRARASRPMLLHSPVTALAWGEVRGRNIEAITQHSEGLLAVRPSASASRPRPLWMRLQIEGAAGLESAWPGVRYSTVDRILASSRKRSQGGVRAHLPSDQRTRYSGKIGVPVPRRRESATV